MTHTIHRMALAAMTLLVLIRGGIAFAAESRSVDAIGPVSQDASLTYFDLALQFAPGLARTPVYAGELARISHLGGSEMSATIASPAIGSVSRLDIIAGGSPAMLLLYDFGNADDAAQSVSIMALYDMTAAPRLLDVMDVGLDRETFFQEPKYAALAPGLGMVFVRNSHHNAGEEYLQTSLIAVRNGKFQKVDTIYSMSWNAGPSQIRTTFDFTPAKDATAVDTTVNVRTTHCDGGCASDETAPADIERFTVRYGWDKATGRFHWPKNAYDRIPMPNMEE